MLVNKLIFLIYILEFIQPFFSLELYSQYLAKNRIFKDISLKSSTEEINLKNAIICYSPGECCGFLSESILLQMGLPSNAKIPGTELSIEL